MGRRGYVVAAWPTSEPGVFHLTGSVPVTDDGGSASSELDERGRLQAGAGHPRPSGLRQHWPLARRARLGRDDPDDGARAARLILVHARLAADRRCAPAVAP